MVYLCIGLYFSDYIKINRNRAYESQECKGCGE